MAPTETRSDEPENPRRGFLRRIWMLLGGLAALEFLWMGFDMARPRSRRRPETDAGTIYTAGRVERFEPGSVTAFPDGRFYLARLATGGFLALSRTCTHLGCTVPWIAEDQSFACPGHSSAFDITGAVTNPPAERALDLDAVRIENGIVKVDLGEVVRRTDFDTAQVIRP